MLAIIMPVQAFFVRLYHRTKRVCLVGVVFFGTPLLMHAQTQATSLISADSSGNITFTPSVIVNQLITIVVAGIAAGAGLFFAWTGTRWVYRVVKGSK